MSHYDLTVRHHMSAGHRIEGLPGPGAKCSNVHGHTFGIDWTFRVNTAGAEVIEFAAVKKELRGWVNEQLDHGFIAYEKDYDLIEALKGLGCKIAIVDDWPTTEVIARTIADYVPDPYKTWLYSVRITEGPHNEAVYYV